MLPFKKKRRQKKYPMPKWVFWGTLIFLMLTLYTASLSPSLEQPSMLSETFEQVKGELPEVSQYKKLVPMPEKSKRVLTERGTGVTVLCGQKIALSYQTASGNDLSEITPYEWAFGEQTSDFLNYALSGASIGSTQEFNFSPAKQLDVLIPGAAASPVDALSITIESAIPDMNALFSSDLSLQINDKQTGQGKLLACGDTAGVALKLWGADGALIYQSEADMLESITIGKSQAMLGLEQSLIGMGVGGVRQVIIPPVWQQRLQEGAATDLPGEWTNKKTTLLIAEVRRVN